MRVSIGTSRTDKKWKQLDLTWPEFVDAALQHRTIGTETTLSTWRCPKPSRIS